MGFKEEMEQFDGEWEEAQEKAGSGGAVLPAGDYQARVVVSRVGTNDWGNWTLTLTWDDLGGKGRVTVWDNLDQDVGRSIAASHTKAMGYTGKLSDLEAVCASGFFDDLVCDIRVKDNPAKDNPDKIYKVVYVNRVFARGEGTVGSGGVVRPPDDDDIPF